MIKAEVIVNGVINRQAVMRRNKEGKQYTAFAINVSVEPTKGDITPLLVSVTKDGYDVDTASKLRCGQRVAIKGLLLFHKRGDSLYLDLKAVEIGDASDATADAIAGTLEFKGTVGKSVEQKQGKSGKQFQSFQAFNSEKVADGFEYLWVSFVRFSTENCPALSPKAKVHIHGDLALTTYNGKLYINSKVSDIAEWKPSAQGKPDFNKQPENETCPF